MDRKAHPEGKLRESDEREEGSKQPIFSRDGVDPKYVMSGSCDRAEGFNEPQREHYPGEQRSKRDVEHRKPCGSIAPAKLVRKSSFLTNLKSGCRKTHI